MLHLCIVLDDPVRFVGFEGPLCESITIERVDFTKRLAGSNELVFYDWIIDEHQCVRGLRIHLPPDHPLLQPRIDLDKLSAVEIDCFVNIWFDKAQRFGTPQGKEAFGDIFFYRSATGTLAVVVGLDTWLSPTEVESCLRIARNR